MNYTVYANKIKMSQFCSKRDNKSGKRIFSTKRGKNNFILPPRQTVETVIIKRLVRFISFEV